MTGAKIVVMTSIKKQAHAKGFKIGRGFKDALYNYNLDIIDSAIVRARKNNRKVLQAHDIGV